MAVCPIRACKVLQMGRMCRGCLSALRAAGMAVVLQCISQATQVQRQFIIVLATIV